jgi:plasmid maintenance system antidote protein VapI
MYWVCRHCEYKCEKLSDFEKHGESCWRKDKEFIENIIENKRQEFFYAISHMPASDAWIFFKERAFIPNRYEQVFYTIMRDYKQKENLKTEETSSIKLIAPLHPGKIYYDIILSKSWTIPLSFNLHDEAYELRINEDELSDFINGKKGLDHVLAYKLACNIEGTDVRFWMDLQEKYDEYMRNNVDNK